jgi:DNA-binding MarR family transcriptional regulator
LLLLVVPYMGEVGKMLCHEQGVSWLDLSGNARIVVPALHVRVDGQPNRYKSPGRPANLFAPASSRIARALLSWPERWLTQGELAKEIGMTPGGLSRLVSRYEEAGFVERRPEGRRILLQVRNPGLLLGAWREAYDFSAHDVHRGHIPARSGTELLKQLAKSFGEGNLQYAATGLAAAWLLAPFASFRLVTVYLSQWPPREVLEGLMFRDDAKGANVWPVLPRDEGIYYGAQTTDGIRHVSAVQTYLDLKAQPERSEEAAEELRRTHLKWGQADG